MNDVMSYISPPPIPAPSFELPASFDLRSAAAAAPTNRSACSHPSPAPMPAITAVTNIAVREGPVDDARYGIGCHDSQEKRVHSAWDDAASNIMGCGLTQVAREESASDDVTWRAISPGPLTLGGHLTQERGFMVRWMTWRGERYPPGPTVRVPFNTASGISVANPAASAPNAVAQGRA